MRLKFHNAAPTVLILFSTKCFYMFPVTGVTKVIEILKFHI